MLVDREASIDYWMAYPDKGEDFVVEEGEDFVVEEADFQP